MKLFIALLLAGVIAADEYPAAPVGLTLKCEQSDFIAPMSVLVCGTSTSNGAGDYEGSLKVTFDDAGSTTHYARMTHTAIAGKASAYAVIAIPLFDARRVTKAEFYPTQAAAVWMAQ